MRVPVRPTVVPSPPRPPSCFHLHRVLAPRGGGSVTGVRTPSDLRPCPPSQGDGPAPGLQSLLSCATGRRFQSWSAAQARPAGAGGRCTRTASASSEFRGVPSVPVVAGPREHLAVPVAGARLLAQGALPVPGAASATVVKRLLTRLRSKPGPALQVPTSALGTTPKCTVPFASTKRSEAGRMLALGQRRGWAGERSQYFSFDRKESCCVIK